MAKAKQSKQTNFREVICADIQRADSFLRDIENIRLIADKALQCWPLEKTRVNIHSLLTNPENLLEVSMLEKIEQQSNSGFSIAKSAVLQTLIKPEIGFNLRIKDEYERAKRVFPIHCDPLAFIDNDNGRAVLNKDLLQKWIESNYYTFTETEAEQQLHAAMSLVKTTLELITNKMSKQRWNHTPFHAMLNNRSIFTEMNGEIFLSPDLIKQYSPAFNKEN